MKQKPLKDALISVRIPQALKERVRAVESRTRITSSILAWEALEAICQYVEHRGEIRLPFALVPKAELKTLEKPGQNHPA
jgi:predicted DNA-binding protein